MWFSKLIPICTLVLTMACGGRSRHQGERGNDPGVVATPGSELPGEHGGSTARPGPCDPKFLAPFCKDERIIGFDEGAWTSEAPPSILELRQYSLQAVNHIRALTCLPPLQLDERLNSIADKALAANSGHGYFIKNCMNAAHDFGRRCEAGWTQENIGSASGSGRTWKHGIHVPLCLMMEEPKGVGHRSNIESAEWKRLGVGIQANANGASWFHEFGN